MIKYLKKDLTEINKGVVVHGCNCSGGFGAGVALAVKNKWPTVEKAFRTVKNPKLGEIQIVSLNDELVVINGFTQEKFGYDNKRYADLDAIETVIKKSIDTAKAFGIRNLYMPKIGSCRGGLNWVDEIYPMLNSLDNKGVTINVCIL
jgi:O-acetyl-ADP-ribose deacetylase (regulator of RNase III)